MTFDEAIKRLSQDIDKNGGQEKYQKEVIATLKSLQKEYAPTIEMTKAQNEILVLSRNNSVNRVDKVGLLEFMSAYSLLNQEIDHLSLMQAWLHPKIIKVVNE